ncbi:Inositol-1-monophosphatase [Photobacterium damselae subsp. piscicida]|uniref:Inositol-1-monophosphatase n=1 Tax=Photobacterium damsela subsp. piscicida TaxID=38294 RepID=A0A1V1V9N8_PHODP|nr:inositol-1-monophosphatase [Photobacterium damselae]MBE8129936.1 inositol-1-monophosphatase [Photobacterium damselae subsp. piscicida]MDP2516556.1 inositol-1-monophosphatase [Photobacterium damselae subsp. piscicida]PSV77267.1 inositol-1-monophosphatase [Photobacterium damselae]PSW79636.1 inositol-1-monophosphatase [Photobacterium damselae]QOD52126.1 inositol-1-monophosphatase [Photobacterium damselae subsp. piscicida]
MHPMLNIAIRAARKAGDHVIKSLEKTQAITVAKKGNDVVTNIDLEAEAIIIETILKSYPDHCITSAESGVVKEGRDKDCQWIIDPIDGTRNFSRGYPHYAISVALRMRGRTEVAAVYDPSRNELFTATRGAGAQINSQRIRATEPRNLAETVVATGLPFAAKQHAESFQKIQGALFVECDDMRQSSCSALDLCYLAAARVDAVVKLGLKPWEITAGELIAREAGAICTDFTGNTNYLTSGNLVAGNARVVKSILAKIRENGSEALTK